MDTASKLIPAIVASLCLAPVLGALPDDRVTERVSVQSNGAEGNERSTELAISADGRFVAFQSLSNDLVPGDTNFSWDIFVHDRMTGTTTRVSLSTAGGQGNHHCSDPDISGDGRYVVFSSQASNLVAGDSNGVDDVFLHDRSTAETTLLCADVNGVQGNARSDNARISTDGLFAVFDTFSTNLVTGDINGQTDVFRKELATGEVVLVSVASNGDQGDSSSFGPAISADGVTAAFSSSATNLAPGDTNGSLDVFVREIGAGQTTRVSLSTLGAQGSSYSRDPSISADGRFVAFMSRSGGLVPNDTNLYNDVFLHDRQTAETTRVSVGSTGEEGNFTSQRPEVSADGRFVAFESWASNLVPRDNNSRFDIFIRDTLPGVTRRVSITTSGQEGNDHSTSASFSGDGRYVAFESYSDNLVPNDTNSWNDIFVHDQLGTAAVTTRNAGANPMSYTASLPTLGQIWDVSVDVSTTGHTSAILVGMLGSANIPLTSGYELLITGPRVFRLAAQLGPVANWSIPLPDDSSLAGIRVYTQAVHLFGVGPFALSNAQDLCIGY